MRRFQGPLAQEIEKECEELESGGIIRRSYSPYSAPVVPVRKPDGTLRLCIDYRALNKHTKNDAFPLPNLIDAVYNMAGANYFSTIDLVKGYYQIEMAQTSIEKTAFSTPLSHKQTPSSDKNTIPTFRPSPNFLIAPKSSQTSIFKARVRIISRSRLMSYDMKRSNSTFPPYTTQHLFRGRKYLS